jgi:hypothetical protein
VTKQYIFILETDMLSREQSKVLINKSCGSGWLKLIDEVYDKLPDYIKIVQVYQKFAGLNFTIDQHDEEFRHFLKEIEERSKCICEICGNSGSYAIVDGWESTLCEFHFGSFPGVKYKPLDH